MQNFGSVGDNNNEGVVNHDSAAGWTVMSSTIQNNAGAGVMVGSGNRLIGNCLRDNGQYGFNAYSVDGVNGVVLAGNEISGNNTDDWESRQQGCGCTGGGKFWETTGAEVTDNYVHDNRGVGLWADSNNVGFLFQGNYVSGNDAEGVMYETSYNAAIVDNTFVRNALVKGPTNPGFPASAIYLSESGSDTRVEGPYNETLRVSGNVFTDNWSGIVAWENADRFAGSPTNTSTGVGTLVNPSVATVAACATESNITEKPYIDDCRWKTMNVLVEGNVFSVDPSTIPDCSPSNGCGFNGLFSNYGTYPDWSPYQGEVVEEAITFEQNNVWRNNTYTGNWHFMVEESGHSVTWETWRSEPYHQDPGSTLN
ncbi:MAG: right-handed parallel beta-helix repeat-containing protein [Jiangellaceae bacterium]